MATEKQINYIQRLQESFLMSVRDTNTVHEIARESVEAINANVLTVDEASAIINNLKGVIVDDTPKAIAMIELLHSMNMSGAKAKKLAEYLQSKGREVSYPVLLQFAKYPSGFFAGKIW